MGLRFLALLALFGLIAYVVQRFLQGRSAKASPPKAVTSRATVRCEHCGIYVPSSEAIEQRGHYYCSSAHVPAQGDTRD